MNEIDFIGHHTLPDSISGSNIATLGFGSGHFEVAAYDFYKDTNIHSMCGGIFDENNNLIGGAVIHLLPEETHGNRGYKIEGELEGDLESIHSLVKQHNEINIIKPISGEMFDENGNLIKNACINLLPEKIHGRMGYRIEGNLEGDLDSVHSLFKKNK